MTIRRIRSAIGRQLAFWSLLAVVLGAGTGLAGKAWGEEQPAEAAALEQLKASLDEIEASIGRDDITSETLAEHRRALTAAADAIRGKIEELEPSVRELEERLKQLGPAPEKDAPAESEEITNERDELTAKLSELDGALKQYRVLAVKVGQLSERLAQKRHALYASELFARSASILDPTFWRDVSRALPVELRSAAALYDTWISEHPGGGRLLAAVLILIVIAAITIGLSRWWFARLFPGPFETRRGKARTAFWVFVWLAARTPLACLAGLMVLDAFGLLTWRVEQIAQGLVAGIAAAAFGRGIARGLLAPEKPERRLVQEDDDTARYIHNQLVWATRALGVLVILQVVHKALFAPLIITVATNVLFAAVAAAFLSDLIVRLSRIRSGERNALAAAPWVHPLAVVVTVLIIVALVAGYAGLAAFVALRVIVGAAVFAALYLLLIVTQSWFADIGEQSPHGRLLAANLGVSARGVGLGAALLSALIRVTLIVLACLLIIGPWEVSTADLFDTIRNIPFGFKIGEIHVSFRAILAAAAVLAVLLVVTRVVKRWLELELLPRTTLEPSLQLSIATIFGYVGAIAAISFALTGTRIRSAENRADRRRAFGRHRLRTAVSGVELRVRAHPADRAADPGRGFDRGQGRGGMGAARPRASDRDRDLRPGERDHSELGAHHRHRQELDAREHAGAHRRQGRGGLRDRSGPGARYPAGDREGAPANRAVASAVGVSGGLRRQRARFRTALHRGGRREGPVGQERPALRDHQALPGGGDHDSVSAAGAAMEARQSEALGCRRGRVQVIAREGGCGLQVRERAALGGAQRPQHGFGRERELGQPHADRILDGVGDGRRNAERAGFAEPLGAERPALLRGRDELNSIAGTSWMAGIL